MTSTDISSIELEIIHNALTAAAAEMDVTVWRTSRSTIVRELLDYSTAIFDRDGWNVAQAARIPSHLNSMSYFLTEILARHIPADQWQPDDIVISNDPYCGGQHLPDIVAYKAVFHEGRRIGFVGTLCHHLDVGGSSPGSYGSSATEIFQEGLRIPPVKLFEAGKLIEPIRAIILQNVRQPELLWGDLQSQIASLNVGAVNIERLARKLGEVRFERALKQLLDASEAGMRAVISRIADGTYEFEDKIDDDGITDQPIHIHARVTVAGEEMTVDLSGCSAQSLGPSNATLASTCSTVFYALMATADVPVPSNAGCYRPVKIIAPPGLCVNAAAPAPVVHRIAVGHRLATVLFGALHRAVPQRMPAAYYAVSYVVTFQTIDAKLGRKVLVEIEIGGCGGLSYSDGASAHSFGMHNNANIPMEMIESDMPLTFLGYGLLTDSGGAGRHRGGLGLWREWRIDCPAAQLSTNLDRFKFRPFGLDGGEPAALSALYLIRDGVRQALPSKVTNMMVKEGDIVRLETSGGGGFGDPRMRDAALIERDMRHGYVSSQAAAALYGHTAKAAV
ncbi:MAG TPA: hydantoinase B/oxoprolinase family protein [Hyphomicrobiaceae bacterium]|nr:hydantoinase B/oxoprolinase family protein [Hyphomicrobiaceae bacterium]